MLSPPRRMCSPTASRESTRSPPSSLTAINVKSVVPPPTSQTRMMSPTLTFLRHFSPSRGEPGVERGLGLLQQCDMLQARLRRPPRSSARGPRGRTTPAPSGRRPGFPAVRPRPCRAIRAFQASRRCSRYAADAATGETLRTSSAAVQGRMGARRSTPRARASSWPSSPAGPEPWHRARAQAIRVTRSAAISRAVRAPPPETPRRPGSTGTTARSGRSDTSLTRRPAEPRRLDIAPGSSVEAVGVGIRQRRVRGSQVDANHIARHHGISTSAGESTELVARHRQQRQVDAADTPAVVLEHALKWRRPVDVADQADRGRVEIGRDLSRALPRQPR